MSRRRFLQASALIGASAVASTLAPRGVRAQAGMSSATSSKPIRIIMGGYGPATTGFSLALKRIGDRLEAKFGDGVEVKYVYNIIDLGYRGDDILWLVEDGVLSLGYQSSSYLTERVPDLGVADLPFLFANNDDARAAMDGELGQTLTDKIEAGMNYRILGYFENGLRHVSNRLRSIRSPADMDGLDIRVLPSQIMKRTFELLGASPRIMDLSEAITAIQEGKIDAQENPFANTVTYGIDKYHRFHTATAHAYLSRPIFLHRPTFDSWPPELQAEMRAAVKDAVAFQRDLHVKEEDEAAQTIRAGGGEIIDLTAAQHRTFVDAVRPIYAEARQQYPRDLLALVNIA